MLSEGAPSVTHTVVGPWSLWLSCGLLGDLVFVFLLSMKLKKAVTRSIVPAIGKYAIFIEAFFFHSKHFDMSIGKSEV